MAARYEISPIPNLTGYTFGEKLGAGSYGRNQIIIIILIYLDWFFFRNCI